MDTGCRHLKDVLPHFTILCWSAGIRIQSKDLHSRPCSGSLRTSSRCLILSTKMPQHTKPWLPYYVLINIPVLCLYHVLYCSYTLYTLCYYVSFIASCPTVLCSMTRARLSQCIV